MNATQKKVSIVALEARLRRHLEKEGLLLRKCSPRNRWYQDYGDYYVTDMNNALRDSHVNLENLAREDGILRPFEIVAGEKS